MNQASKNPIVQFKTNTHNKEGFKKLIRINKEFLSIKIPKYVPSKKRDIFFKYVLIK